jgi:hypothetical protein
MTHLKGAVWTERLLLVLILASLGGTLNLVLAVHRRVNAISSAPPAETVAQPEPPVIPPAAKIANSPRPTPPAATPGPNPAPPASAAPPSPAEDPTAKILARMDGAIERERDAASEADRRTASLEAAIRNSVAESQRWKRREMLVRQQVAKLNRRAEQLEQAVMTEDAERDVLARERDALKAATVKASQRSGYSVLPYKGPNGTWRRPIVLECSGNTVKLMPGGKTFSMLELSPLINPRSSPVILAIAREMLHIQQSETPDGAPAVPYLVFLVRPDGIRPYYQARGRLESLGVAFGYELIEQDLVVDVPNFDDVKTWDGSVPLDLPELANNDANASRGWPPSGEPQGQSNAGDSPASAGGDRTAANEPPALGAWPPAVEGDAKAGSDRRWPDLARGDAAPSRTVTGSNASDGGMTGPASALNAPGGNSTRGQRSAGDGSPDDFVWPSNSGEGRPGGGRGAGGSGRGTADDGGMGPVVAGMPSGGPSGTDPSQGFPPGPGGTGPGSGSGGAGRGSSATGTQEGRIGSAAGSNGGGVGDPPGLGAGLGSMGSSNPGTGSGSSGNSAIGQPGSDLTGGGGPLSPGRFAVSGPATGSPSGGGMSGDGNNAAKGNGSSTSLANGDSLPDLEPAQDGASPSGSKTGGLASSADAGGARGPGLGGMGPGTSAMGGGPSNASARPGSQTGSAGGGTVATAGAGQPGSASGGPYAAAGGGQPGSANGGQSASAGGQQSDPANGQPGGGTTPAGKDGTEPPDLGFAPYAGGPSNPPAGAIASGSPADGGTPSSGGGGNLAANTPASANGSGPGAATDTAQSGPGTVASSGSGGSTQQAGNPGATGSLAGTAPSTTTATRLPASSLNANASSTASGSGGVPPTPYQAAMASAASSSSSSSSLANAFGSGTMDSPSGNLSDALGSMSASPSTPSSSSSSSSSSGDSGGQPQTPMPPGTPGMSLPSINLNANPDSEPDPLKELALPPIDTHRQPGRIEVPFEIVVVCRREDVLLHPGGYRITTKALREGAAKANNPDGLLKRELRTIVLRRAQVDPLIRPKPRLKFLVETGGGTTFWTAQQQLIFSGLDWPMAVQVAGPQSQTAQLFGEGTRR